MIAIPYVGVISPFFVDKAFYYAYLYAPMLLVYRAEENLSVNLA